MGGLSLLDGDAPIVAHTSTIFAFELATNRMTGDAGDTPLDVTWVLLDEFAKLWVGHPLK